MFEDVRFIEINPFNRSPSQSTRQLAYPIRRGSTHFFDSCLFTPTPLYWALELPENEIRNQ
jgi:hypothetical protein